MTEAVFFDWFTTLADYVPARCDLYCQAFDELGIKIPVDAAIRGVLLGDECVYSENLRFPLSKRTREERMDVYLAFPRMIAGEARLEASDEVLRTVRDRIRGLFQPTTFVLFDDVLPTMKILKERGLILGVITNLRDDMTPVCDVLGLSPYLSFTVTSGQVGAGKPNPAIFQAALEKAGVSAGVTTYVGDQYKLDIVGARGVGIEPILIDRCDLYEHITDCPRIRTLAEVPAYIS
ncbi:MAG: HAD-IA family hydrolase [Chloroflexota bacterium]